MTRQLIAALGVVIGLGLWLQVAIGQPTPIQQCIASASAGGTGDAITIPALPCALTTNLLILTAQTSNQTTTPTLQPLGLPAQTIVRPDGTALAPGDISAVGYKALLNPTGSKWVLLNPANFPATGLFGGVSNAVAAFNSIGFLTSIGPLANSVLSWNNVGAPAPQQFTSQLPVIGTVAGGLGQGSRSGTTTTFGTTNGTLNNGHCVSIDSTGNLVDAGGTCSVGGGGGTVTTGNANQVAYYPITSNSVAGGNISSFLVGGSGISITGTTSATIAGTFLQPDTSAQTRTALAHGQDWISVGDFLPTNFISGTTDYSTYFQAAANAGCAAARNSQGIRIFIPAMPNGSTGASYHVHDITQSCGNFWFGSGRGACQIDYSGASSFFMLWQVTSWPSFLTGTNVEGGGFADCTVNDAASGSRVAFEVFGFQDWMGERLLLNNPYNAFEFAGDEFPTLSEVTVQSGRNQDVQQIGTIQGCSNGAPGPCTPCTKTSATCSTRIDSLQVRNSNFIDNTGTSTCLWIQGFVSDTNLVHVACEGSAYGMHVSCQANLNVNMAQCPQHIFTWDFETEFTDINPLFWTDAVQGRFTQGYFYGDGTSNNTFDIDIATINYAASGVPCCRLTFDSSLMFAAWNDNVVMSGGPLWDITFVNNEINGANISGGGGNGVNFGGATVNHFHIGGNTFGNVDNYAGANPMTAAVQLSAGSKWGTISDNSFDGVSTSNSPVVLNGAGLSTIHIDGNVGPGQGPSIVSGCGGGATLSGSNGDRSFTLNAGHAPAPGTCTITFGTLWPATPECFAQPAPGAAFVGVATAANQVALGSPTASAVYGVRCGLN